MKIKRWCSFWRGGLPPLIERSPFFILCPSLGELSYHSLATTLTSTLCFQFLLPSSILTSENCGSWQRWTKRLLNLFLVVGGGTEAQRGQVVEPRGHTDTDSGLGSFLHTSRNPWFLADSSPWGPSCSQGWHGMTYSFSPVSLAIYLTCSRSLFPSFSLAIL